MPTSIALQCWHLLALLHIMHPPRLSPPLTPALPRPLPGLSSSSSSTVYRPPSFERQFSLSETRWCGLEMNLQQYGNVAVSVRCWSACGLYWFWNRGVLQCVLRYHQSDITGVVLSRILTLRLLRLLHCRGLFRRNGKFSIVRPSRSHRIMSLATLPKLPYTLSEG
jgi:hypothetical protein